MGKHSFIRSSLRLNLLLPALLIILFCCTTNAAIEVSGSLIGLINSRESDHNPARQEGLPWMNRTYSSSPSIFNNELRLEITGSGDNYSLYLPFRFQFQKFDIQGEDASIYRLRNNRWWPYWPYPNLTVRTGNFEAALRQYRIIPQLGIMGNFYATYRSSYIDDLIMMMNWKPRANMDVRLNLIRNDTPVYYNYAKRVETLPKQVAELRTGGSGTGPTVGSYDGIWTRDPTLWVYGGVEGSAIIQTRDRWGIYFGRVLENNPRFLVNDQDQNGAAVSVYNGQSARLGYTKDALELNWVGRLRPGSRGRLTLAGSVSQAAWRAILPNSELREVSLGTVGGRALLIDLVNERFGDLTLNTTYRVVEPDYQWVMNYYRDPKPNLTDPAAETPKLMDVSRYLGRQNLDVSLELPGKIMGTDSVLNTKISANKWFEREWNVVGYDDEMKLYVNEDYLHTQVGVDVRKSTFNRYSIAGFLRQFPKSEEHMQGAEVLWDYYFNRNLLLTTNLQLRQRHFYEVRKTQATNITSKLEGRSTNGTVFRISCQIRDGNYDYGLLEFGYDQPVHHYYYRVFEAKAKRSIDINVSRQRIRVTIGGHIWDQNTNLSSALNGTSIIGYLGLSTTWFGSIRQSFSITASRGPQDESFPTAYVKNAIANDFTYRLGRRNDSTLRLKTVYYTNESQLVAAAQYEIKMSHGSLNFAYGRWFEDQYSNSSNGHKVILDVWMNGRRRHPMDGSLLDEWNYWWLAQERGYMTSQYNNWYSLEYRIRF